MHDAPTPQMIFWKLGEWRCEYWRTTNQRRLIVFFRGEPLIDQPVRRRRVGRAAVARIPATGGDRHDNTPSSISPHFVP